MERTGTALDNAMAESFVSTLKAELVSDMEFPSRQAARTAIFEYLETSYNTRRLHSSLADRGPVDFEEDKMEKPRSRKVKVSVLAGNSNNYPRGNRAPPSRNKEVLRTSHPRRSGKFAEIENRGCILSLRMAPYWWVKGFDP
jgi:hypothetical protein